MSQPVKKAQLGPWAKAHKRHLQKFFPEEHRRLVDKGQLNQVAFKAQENAKEMFAHLSETMDPNDARETAVRQFIYPTPPEDEDHLEEWETHEGELNQQGAVMSMLAKALQKASRRNPPRTLPVTTGSKTLVN